LTGIAIAIETEKSRINLKKIREPVFFGKNGDRFLQKNQGSILRTGSNTTVKTNYIMVGPLYATTNGT
jgi:hypothetical protein